MSTKRVQIQRGTPGTDKMYVFCGQSLPGTDGKTIAQTADMLSSAPPAGFPNNVELPAGSDISLTYGTQKNQTELDFQVYSGGVYQVQLDMALAVNGDVSNPYKNGPSAEECKVETVDQPGNSYIALIIPADF